MISEVTIPREHVDAVRSDACADWLIAHTTGSVIGLILDGTMRLRFEEDREAAEFSTRWLVDTG